MEHERKEGIEINIRKLIFACLDKWWLIVLFAVLATTASGLITAKAIQPKYRSNVTMYVNNAADYEKINYISSSNLSAAEQLINTYIAIISTDSVMAKVAAKANEVAAETPGVKAPHFDAATVHRCLSAYQVGETVLIRVSIVHTNPKVALIIARAVEAVMPAELGAIVGGSSTKVVDWAAEAKTPFSPNIRRNCVLGGAAGSAIAVLIVILMYMLDVRIKDEEDLNAISTYPVLGQIPEFAGDEDGESETSKGKGGKV